MLIRDILNLKGSVIHGIAASDSLAEAVSRMVARDIGSLVVMEGDAMCGMLTFREALRALDSFGGGCGPIAVRRIMDGDPICGAPGDTIDELRELMTRHHIRYLPVKENEALVGVISFHDVAKAVIMQTDMENRLLRRYIESEREAVNANGSPG
jgi:CBS domain-containing protein